MTDAFRFDLPDEPYRTIAAHYRDQGVERITPRDSETRLFLTDIPLVASSEAMSPDRTVHLSRDGVLLIHGVRDRAAAELHRDIARFSLFVHFFADISRRKRAGILPATLRTQVRDLIIALPAIPASPPLATGPFSDERSAQRAIIEAGVALVTTGLVDSIFGNISYRLEENLFITRTGTALERLEHGIVRCPLAEVCCKKHGASTEYPSHRRIVLESGFRAVLHGHPRWTVIRSLVDEAPMLYGLPVIEGDPGEGLSRVLPDAVTAHGAAIVRGHGLFAAGSDDLRAPFETIRRIEQRAFEEQRIEMS